MSKHVSAPELLEKLAQLVFACNWRDACACGSDAEKARRAVEDYGRAMDEARALIDKATGGQS